MGDLRTHIAENLNLPDVRLLLRSNWSGKQVEVVDETPVWDSILHDGSLNFVATGGRAIFFAAGDAMLEQVLAGPVETAN